jgi:hypothetical protein
VNLAVTVLDVLFVENGPTGFTRRRMAERAAPVLGLLDVVGRGHFEIS